MRQVRRLLLSKVMRSPSMVLALATLISLLAGCAPGAEARRWAIGGTVRGLEPGRSVELANGTDTVTVQADGPFAFREPAALHSTYTVSVTSQPAGQQCTVRAATGRVRGPVVLEVTCVDEAARSRSARRWLYAGGR